MLHNKCASACAVPLALPSVVDKGLIFVCTCSAHAQTHWRATLRLHRVWKNLSIREELGQPQKDSHGGQAIQVPCPWDKDLSHLVYKIEKKVRNMFEMLCLLRGAEAALQVPRHL